jgi:Protein of unknown function (DUF732)
MSSQRVIAPRASRSPAPDARHARRSRWEKWLLVCLIVTSALLLALAAGIRRAHADTGAYLIEVTVRPGYNFASSTDALAYGYAVCDKVSQGRRYADLMGDVKSDFHTGDEFQASYLIDKAVDDLCPALIWQLRNSAADYRPTTG